MLSGCQGGQASSPNRGSADKTSTAAPAQTARPTEAFEGKTSGTPATLYRHMEALEVRYRNAKQDDVETSHANLLAYSQALEQTADTLLAIKDAPSDLRLTAAQAKLKAIRDRFDLVPADFDKFFAAADEIERDNPKSDIARFVATARFQTVSTASQTLFTDPQDQLEKTIDQLIKLANVEPVIPEAAEALNTFGLMAELRGKPEKSAQLFELIVKRFSDHPLAKFASGAVHRLQQRGKVVTDVAGKNFDGKPVSATDFRGKILLVDFWATWCKPCMQEMPDLREMRRMFQGQGINFEILGVCLDPEQDSRRAQYVIESTKMAWPQIFDAGDSAGISSPLALAYGIGQIPHKLLLDPDGVLVTSGVDLKELAIPLGKLLQADVKKREKAKAEKSGAESAKANAPKSEKQAPEPAKATDPDDKPAEKRDPKKVPDNPSDTEKPGEKAKKSAGNS
jgi:thiol-disulfide isomerase/thioredoxin